jgi:hypothetical protein
VTCRIRTFGIAALLAVAADLNAQSLSSETFRGAFVTMTKGATCPSSSTISFKAQGEASGQVPGRFDEEGSIRLLLDRGSSRVSIQVFSSAFTINTSQVRGRLWQDVNSVMPLHVTCDPLTLRIDGHVAYAVTTPFTEEGFAELRILASRRGITGPYYGSITVAFSAAR